jgi:hypothetical protein
VLEIVSIIVGIVVGIGGVLLGIVKLVWELMKHIEKRKREQSPLQKGLRILLDNYSLAREEGKSSWDFAVETSVLREVGLNNSDFRALLQKGYVEHAEAITRPGCSGRAFRQRPDYIFSDDICFVLTEKGAEYARCHLGNTRKE